MSQLPATAVDSEEAGSLPAKSSSEMKLLWPKRMTIQDLLRAGDSSLWHHHLEASKIKCNPCRTGVCVDSCGVRLIRSQQPRESQLSADDRVHMACDGEGAVCVLKVGG